MLIYLFIAAELALLYTVFWYVYVREPKDYIIKGSLWGQYRETKLTTGGVESFPTTVDPNVKDWLRPSTNYAYQVGQINQDSINSANPTGGVERHKRTRCRWSYLESTSFEQIPAAQTEMTMVKRMLRLLYETVEGFSVKLP